MTESHARRHPRPHPEPAQPTQPARPAGAHRAEVTVTGNQKFLRLTQGQIVLLLFAAVMIAVVAVSIYIGKYI